MDTTSRYVIETCRIWLHGRSSSVYFIYKLLTQLLSHDALFSHSICSSIYSYALILLFSFFLVTTYIAAFVNVRCLHSYLLLLLFKDYGMWFYVWCDDVQVGFLPSSRPLPAGRQFIFCCTAKLTQHTKAYE